MKFLADKDIPYVREAFSTLGDVSLCSGSEIKPGDVKKFDGLLVRTTTRVDANLLTGSSIQFVATATIGTDHIDLPFLEQNQIGFSAAPGSNAAAVAEYVINALLTLNDRKGFSLRNQILGIIGVGNVGTQLKKRAEILGIPCLLNDPPLQEQTGNPVYRSRSEVIQNSTILSLHVPLIRNGDHPTFHLFAENELKAIKPDTILINTCRGEVINESALLNHRAKLRGVILDVWENEPCINLSLLEKTDLATYHIAGYSKQGKLRATKAIYQAACRHFQLQPIWKTDDLPEASSWLDIDVASADTTLQQILSQIYDIEKDDQILRNIAGKPDYPDRYKKLRENYPFRQELERCRINNSNKLPEELRTVLRGFGVRLR